MHPIARDVPRVRCSSCVRTEARAFARRHSGAGVRRGSGGRAAARGASGAVATARRDLHAQRRCLLRRCATHACKPVLPPPVELGGRCHLRRPGRRLRPPRRRLRRLRRLPRRGALLPLPRLPRADRLRLVRGMPCMQPHHQRPIRTGSHGGAPHARAATAEGLASQTQGDASRARRAPALLAALYKHRGRGVGRMKATLQLACMRCSACSPSACSLVFALHLLPPSGFERVSD
mmetsp:Transcript_41136/g.86110  ORF Transcript_41136/g.86110 Transcript_41136/m.86110 type:complete len:234 (-) Transcript_41136:387-1088(-)